MLKRMSLSISRVLHAGYIFESQGAKILFDPIFENPFSVNCYAFPQVEFREELIKELRPDAIFISHYHDDHCSMQSLNLLDRRIPIYLYCLHEALFVMLRNLGFLNVYSLQINQEIKIGSLNVIIKKALDADVDSIFHIAAEDLNILHVVDSWIDFDTLEQLAQVQKWDMILWPFQTMREIEVLSPIRSGPAVTSLPPEWLEQLKILRPRYIVPSSCQFIHEEWSWYRLFYFPISYEQFQKEIEQILPETQVVRLNPSTSVLLTSQSLDAREPLKWVVPVGEQNVDYTYDQSQQVPSTNEVARHFSALTQQQTEFVLEYCRHGLIKKYLSLVESNETYFLKARLWKLSVVDHLGLVTDFYYEIHSQKMHLVMGDHSVKGLGWVTEIPLFKLYQALTAGESLSSLYIRINNQIFDDEIEDEIKEADFLADPLLRCLFTEAFGSYQLAQLKRLGIAF